MTVSFDPAQWLSWLERRPVTAEVTGSSPVWVVCSESVYAGSANRHPALTLGYPVKI